MASASAAELQEQPEPMPPPPRRRRLLVRSMEPFYTSGESELLATVHKHVVLLVQTTSIGDDDKKKACSGCARRTLPLEICQRIVDFCVIEPVRMDQVSVVSCSSQDRNQVNGRNLQDVLSESERSWWISAPGSMPGGVGREWLEFQLVPAANKQQGVGDTACRLTEISIKIPPLPRGPLSLRTFQIETTTSDTDDDWQVLCYNHVTNRAGWQRFAVTPTDCFRVRLVCLSNQISLFNTGDNFDPPRMQRFAAVGLFSIQFA